MKQLLGITRHCVRRNHRRRFLRSTDQLLGRVLFFEASKSCRVEGDLSIRSRLCRVRVAERLGANQRIHQMCGLSHPWPPTWAVRHSPAKARAAPAHPLVMLALSRQDTERIRLGSNEQVAMVHRVLCCGCHMRSDWHDARHWRESPTEHFRSGL